MATLDNKELSVKQQLLLTVPSANNAMATRRRSCDALVTPITLENRKKWGRGLKKALTPSSLHKFVDNYPIVVSLSSTSARNNICTWLAQLSVSTCRPYPQGPKKKKESKIISLPFQQAPGRSGLTSPLTSDNWESQGNRKICKPILCRSKKALGLSGSMSA